MQRKIINIDEEKCNGCGACAKACHEGAIAMVNGKAKLMRDDYCDGLGDCLPVCPTNAISFIVREAAEYDEAAVMENKKKKLFGNLPFKGCPGTQAQQLKPSAGGCPGTQARKLNAETTEAPLQSETVEMASCLSQWPVQIKLAPVNAPYFDGAKLLIAADCSAYAYANFHQKFMKGHVTLIGCPKLDSVDYSEKLTEIIRTNNIKSVSIVRMVVPCCGGLENAVKKALQDSGKFIPWQVYTLSLDGKLMDI